MKLQNLIAGILISSLTLSGCDPAGNADASETDSAGGTDAAVVDQGGREDARVQDTSAGHDVAGDIQPGADVIAVDVLVRDLHTADAGSPTDVSPADHRTADTGGPARMVIARWSFEDEDDIADEGFGENITGAITTDSERYDTGFASGYLGVGQAAVFKNLIEHNINHVEIPVDCQRFSQIALSYVARCSDTAARFWKVQLAVGGGPFGDVAPVIAQPGGEWSDPLLLDLPDAARAGQVRIRIVVTDSSGDGSGDWVQADGEGEPSAAGTFRLDDILITGVLDEEVDSGVADLVSRDTLAQDAASADQVAADVVVVDLVTVDAGPCGNGVVDPGEECDTAIEAGQPGACPSRCPQLEPCVRRWIDGSYCQRRCLEAPIEEAAPEPDMCCYEPGDVDCPGPYPVHVALKRTAGNGGTCSSGYWYEVRTQNRVALGTTCGVPVALNFTNVSPGVGDSGFGDLDIHVDTPGATYPGTSYRVDLNGGYRGRDAALLIPVGDLPSFVSSTWETSYCALHNYESSAVWDYRPLESVPVITTGTPTSPVVAGDHNGHFILYREGDSVVVAAGKLTPVNFDWAFHFDSASYLPPSWNGLTAVVSASGQEPAIAVESRAALDDWTTPPHAHVVWVEGDRTLLGYTRVTLAGEVQATQTVRTAVGIAAPQLVRWDGEHLGLVWLEQDSGKSQLRFVRLSLATGAVVGDVVTVTAGEGDALEPSLAARRDQTCGVAWIDTRSGSRQLLLQAIDCATGSITEPLELVSAEAVEPAEPSLQQIGGYPNFRLLWTDQRDGHRALYLKDNLGPGRPIHTVLFLTKTDARLTPSGEDAHHGRLTGDPNADLSYTRLANSKLVWEVGSSGNQVRYGHAKASTEDGYGHPYALTTDGGLRMTCADSSGPDISITVPSGYVLYGPTPTYTLGTWIENGQLVVQALNVSTAPRTPIP